ncbi:hypothetical protein [Gordonia polyisoprenivorans]|uniref:hypothetical protein n=1 Tax=Gordonia polyisoprenivorans TaxID=84595 RepID=UPI001FCB413C|nr:hypothetical protein [Gordonia polyisoprenivorans]
MTQPPGDGSRDQGWVAPGAERAGHDAVAPGAERAGPVDEWTPTPPPPPITGPLWGAAVGGQPGAASQNPGYVPGHFGPPPTHKPGIIPLRPLNVGDLISGTFAAIFGNPRVYFGWSAVVSAIVTVCGLLVLVVVRMVSDSGLFDAAAWLAGGPDAISDAAWVGRWILAGLVAYPVARDVMGARSGWVESWRFARGSMWRILGSTALLGLVTLVCFVPALVLIELGLDSADVGTLVAVLMVTAVLVLGYSWLYIRMSLSVPAAAVEGLGPVAALARSVSLTRRSFGRYFAVVLLLNLISVVIEVVVSYMVDSVTRIGGGVFGDVVAIVLAVIVAALVQPLIAVASALMHVDARIRKEGFDIELNQSSSGGGVPWAPR